MLDYASGWVDELDRRMAALTSGNPADIADGWRPFSMVPGDLRALWLAERECRAIF